jgi:hypothetical protein
VLTASIVIALMMEAASTFETSVNFYQTIWRMNPEGSHLSIKAGAITTQAWTGG